MTSTRRSSVAPKEKRIAKSKFIGSELTKAAPIQATRRLTRRKAGGVVVKAAERKFKVRR
jgi:hypothetical protein